jgi:hypothetical protein
MDYIGKYQGVKCYRCDRVQYEYLYRSNDLKDDIYIIDKDMVRHNKIIGYYDGKNVKDIHDGEEYVKTPKRTKVKETVDKEEDVLVVPEINFADYSGVVDNFFKELKEKG